MIREGVTATLAEQRGGSEDWTGGKEERVRHECAKEKF